jgi:signal transduction histidine kinase/ligand-binding sensor domain-containing protein
MLSAWLVSDGQALALQDLKGAFGSGRTETRGDQSLAGAEALYRVTHWTAENGLPQNTIKALAQTPEGYLWIGTLNGLARFDGWRFNIFDRYSSPAMPNDAINELAVDKCNGSLWIGTANGLLCFHDSQFENYFSRSPVPLAVGVLAPARQGGVWFSPGPGEVALAREGKVKRWKFGAEIPANGVRQLWEESSDRLLLRLASSICRFELNTGGVKALALPGQLTRLGWFMAESDASLWISGAEGIWHLKDGTWEKALGGGEPGSWVTRLDRTADGQMWATQQEERPNTARLSLLVDGKLERLALSDFPADLNFTRLLEDQEGNVWIGTSTGLFRLQRRRLKVYARNEGLRNDDTLAVAAGKDGRVWLGTGEGVSAIEAGKVRNLPPPSDGVWNATMSLMADRHGDLWVGTSGTAQLSYYQNGNWRYVPTPPGVTNAAFIRTLLEDRAGRIWISTGLGVVRGSAGQLDEAYFMTNGLSHHDVRVIYEDRRGDIWFGTFGGGLNRLHEGQLTVFKTAMGERNNRAWWIHEDADGVFWVATEDGLNRFIPPGTETSQLQNRFFRFSTQHGLKENVVNNIQEDQFGYLWLSGLKGIYRVSRQHLNDVATGHRREVECTAYGEADGMLSCECNGGDNQPSGCKDENGHIWFPTAKGLVEIDPKEMMRTEKPPPVVIEQIKANGKVVFGDGRKERAEIVTVAQAQGSGLQATVLPSPSAEGVSSHHSEHHDQAGLRLAPGHGRVVEIHYTANSFTAPERMRFKYQLEGYDSDWVWDDQNRRVAFYTNLRPGPYKFHVTACNPHGFWDNDGKEFAFYVAPFVWQTWPFYISIGVLGVGAAFGLHQVRVNGLRRLQRLEQQRAVHEERGRIARDLHDDLGGSLTGIALQLEAARRGGNAGEHELAALAAEARSLAHEMRELAWTTNPRCDNSGSLVAFVSEYAERFCHAAGLACRLDLPDTDGALPVPARVRHELLVVLKETLANISKHARAKVVTVSLAIDAKGLRLGVRDDGRGFDPTHLNGIGSGLRNMRERIDHIGGSFEVESLPNVGTRVVVELLQEAAKP